MSIYYKIRAYLEKDFELKKEVSFEDDNGTITITRLLLPFVNAFTLCVVLAFVSR